MALLLKDIEPAVVHRINDEGIRNPFIEKYSGEDYEVNYFVNIADLRKQKVNRLNYICKGLRIWVDKKPDDSSVFPVPRLFEFESESFIATPIVGEDAIYIKAYLFESRKEWKVKTRTRRNGDELPRFEIEYSTEESSIDRLHWLAISFWKEWNIRGLTIGQRMIELSEFEPSLSYVIDMNPDTFKRSMNRLGLKIQE